MPGAQIRYEEMEELSQVLKNAHEDMSGKLTQVKGKVDSLVSGGGFTTDVSSKKFQEAYHEFNSGVSNTLQGMEEMASYLNKKIQQYREIDAG